ncbi:MAG: SAM-dependent methyltransferase [Rubrobacter sp.]
MSDEPRKPDYNRYVESFYRNRYSNDEEKEAPASIHYGFSEVGDNPDGETAMQNMNRILAEAVALTGDDIVLDAGCGFGGSSVWISSEYGARVVGLNLVEDQLPHARRHAERRNVSHLTRFVSGDFTDTKLPPGSFDVVWAIESVCHTPDKAGFLRESSRLLRPGGRLVVADFFLRERSLGAKNRKTMNRFLSGWAIPDLPRPGEFSDAAARAGLLKASARDITENILPSSHEMYRQALLRSYPKNLVYSKLGLRPREDFTNARSTVEQYRTLKKGLWHYGIFTATKSSQADPHVSL